MEPSKVNELKNQTAIMEGNRKTIAVAAKTNITMIISGSISSVDAELLLDIALDPT